MVDVGPAACSIKLGLRPFTLIDATQRAGMLTQPLRDRFGIDARLEFYRPEKLAPIVHRFDSGPVGLDNVAAANGEVRDTIEEAIEPYLFQQGYLQRTPSGRAAEWPGGHAGGLPAPGRHAAEDVWGGPVRHRIRSGPRSPAGGSAPRTARPGSWPRR